MFVKVVFSVFGVEKSESLFERIEYADGTLSCRDSCTESKSDISVSTSLVFFLCRSLPKKDFFDDIVTFEVAVSIESFEAVLVSEMSDEVVVTLWSGEGPCRRRVEAEDVSVAEDELRFNFLLISSLALLVYSLGVFELALATTGEMNIVP